MSINPINPKKVIVLIIILVIVAVVVSGVIYYLKVSEKTKESTTLSESEDQKTMIEFSQSRKVDLGEGIFANIIFANDHFYISYEAENQGIFLNIYDQDFVFQEKHQLAHKEGADHQLVYSNGYFYLANSFNLKKFDLNFKEIKSVDYLSQSPQAIREKWSDGVNDMLLAVGNNSLYLGMASGNVSKDDKGRKIDRADDLYLQKYDYNLGLQKDWLLKDMGNTPGSSLLENDDGFTIITSDKHWDDSSLIAASYDWNGNLLDKKTISAATDTNEEFPMGALRQNNTYFIAYEYISGDLSQPTIGEPIRRVDVMIKAFDQNWNLLGQTMVTEDLSDEDLRFHLRAPHLAFVDNKLYITYSIVNGSPRIFIKEYEIK